MFSGNPSILFTSLLLLDTQTEKGFSTGKFPKVYIHFYDPEAMDMECHEYVVIAYVYDPLKRDLE